MKNFLILIFLSTAIIQLGCNKDKGQVVCAPCGCDSRPGPQFVVVDKDGVSLLKSLKDTFHLTYTNGNAFTELGTLRTSPTDTAVSKKYSGLYVESTLAMLSLQGYKDFALNINGKDIGTIHADIAKAPTGADSCYTYNTFTLNGIKATLDKSTFIPLYVLHSN